jgi:diguanylate cyclase (GGDEF)-like protein/PAS domain S-box-containing protein
MATKSILVVEDEVLVARDIQARLSRMGYEVVGMASRGLEAISKALELRPNLILMDINLRDEMDGVEAAAEIRRQFKVPIIFCTAYSNDETLQRAKVTEPYGYVLKPFDNRELEINIEIALYKHKTEIDLAITRQRLDATLTNVSDGVIAAGTDGQIHLLNPMAEKITGWVFDEAVKASLSDVMSIEVFDSEQAPVYFNQAEIFPEQHQPRTRLYLTQESGCRIAIEMSVNRMKEADSNLMVITFRDISEQINHEEAIRKNAFFDSLTELPNRSLFVDRLDSSLNRRKRGKQQEFAVLFLDIDGFGFINDGLGHDHGDHVIREIGRRLDKTVRPDDTVSRFSGDIFAVLLDPVDGMTGAIQACQRILEAIEEPMELAGTLVNISASVGIVLDQGNYRLAEDMIRDADTALHRAKVDAKGSYVVFDNDMFRDAKKFLERKSGIQQALLEGSFEVHYQPIVDAESGEMNSMEALVRWPHPTEGMISPAEFIPIAEETGLILPLGEWVLRSVCQQIKRWDIAGYSGFRVAVNLSARQFENNIPSLVEEIMIETGVSSNSLTLEITEGIAMKNVDQNIRMLEELRALGLNISIDDFGTGYSSLAYLKRFPLNTLKIDRSFIKDITNNTDDREITKAIIAMGQNLNLKVLAEGVETQHQLDILRSSGCDYIQGYFFSRPLPACEVVSFLKNKSLLNKEPLELIA